MDKRSGLKPGDLLAFPGLACLIESEIGRGSNAIVYRGWYEDGHHAGERHEVLIRELFPLHPRGAVFRDEAGNITCAPEGRETFDMHRRSFEAGNAAHLALLRTRPDEVGANLNTFGLNNTLYTVMGASGGRPLAAAADGPAARLRPLTERMLKLLDALEVFHQGGLLHLDIAPDNVLLVGAGRRERVLLIDYNSCLRIGDAARRQPVISSVKPGYTAPEIRGRKLGELCPATDLYSVAAVFFRLLTGVPLTPFQMTRPRPPEVGDCPCLRDAPQTVRSWVRHILVRGLCALPARRYACVEAMREDLQELLDRIDGVGITHWALWEAGRHNVDRWIWENPSLGFMRDPEAVYPANAEGDDGVMPVEARVEALMSQGGESALLVAGGGMGKSTALLKAAFGQPRQYVPARPAIAYIPLYGWREGSGDYVLDRVLETLRFKPQTHSYDDARQALLALLDQPLRERGQEAPVLLLLLDGMNEAAGERKPLIDEIVRLSRMRGVRILATSRVDEESLPFRRLKLVPLRETDIRATLSGAGLLMPQAPQLRELLRVPLMLSIFVASSRAGQRQPGVRTQDELMRAWFEALKEKELATQPENAGARWQIEVATDLVLPAMAREMGRKQRALSDAELLPVVERCYRLFGSRLLCRAFPRWIGRSAAVRGGAKNAEEWYGRIVHDLLWKRLGLLLRDEQGRCQASHQRIGDYLIGVDRENRRRLDRLKWLRRGVYGAVAILALGAAAASYRAWVVPALRAAGGAAAAPYEEALAQTVFESALDAYVTAGLQCENLGDLLTGATQAPERLEQRVEDYSLNNAPGVFSADEALARLSDMLASGDVMPWSGLPMDGRACERLLEKPGELGARYVDIAEILLSLVRDEGADSGRSAQYVRLVRELLEADARMVADLYALACEPHLVGPYAGDGGSTKGGMAPAMLIPMVNRQAQAAAGLTQQQLQADIEALDQSRDALLDAILRYGRDAG